MAFTYQYPHPAVTTDVVVFTIQDSALKVLLVMRGGEPFKGSWALPGGFIKMDEDLETGALRELREETGVKDVYIEQLATFGAVNRDPRERVITVAYYALIPSEKLVLKAATDADATAWFAINKLPTLAFDHKEILTLARKRLSAKIDYSTLAFQFLPDLFTLTDVQSVYEIIKGEPIDKRNFRRDLLAQDFLVATNKERKEGAGRPAQLFKVKTRKLVMF